MKQLTRLGLTLVFALSAIPAEGSLLLISDLALNGGTLVHDGQESVTSSDGTASGTILTFAQLGFVDADLATQLAGLTIDGVITNEAGGTSVTLDHLRLVGLVTLPCSTCSLLSDVRLGSSLGLRDAGDTQNVLFAVDLVGGFGATGPALWSPSDQTPDAQLTGQTFTYSLTPDQITFIVSRMATYGTGDVRLGLAASYDGPLAEGPYGARVEVRSQSVPEPGTLLLLASGIGIAGLRRFRAAQFH